jgi:hypothetical protein
MSFSHLSSEIISFVIETRRKEIEPLSEKTSYPKGRAMCRILPEGFANRSPLGVARCLLLMRGVIRTGARYADKRRAAKRAKREQRCSEMKLTDELERRIAQRFMRNHGFRL